jgi:signal transduction histidine kinase/CheY-like chemotaxis protein
MRRSISRGFLLRLGLTSVGFTALASIAAFVGFEHELESRQVQFLSQYVEERTDNVDRRFSDLITLQRSAIDALKVSAAGMTPDRAAALIDQETRLQPDGTRRSRPREFDGHYDQEGGRTYGVGAFFANAGDIDLKEQAVLAAAFPIVARLGQAAHGSYDNFYFFTPKNRVVMFGPDRPDRLMFYRHDAPASLDFSKEEMNRFVAPGADPSGETRCTSLQRLLQDSGGVQRVATACITPAYVDGRFVGAFGSSINLTSFFARVMVEGFPGAESLIVRNDGQLIAAPHAPLAATRNERAVADYERRLGLKKLTAELATRGRSFGVVHSANGQDIIAYGRLKGPSWYLLLRYPAGAIVWSAARSASWTLLLGLIGAALQTAMLLRLAQGSIVRPLQALAASCESDAQDRSSALTDREDEIGVLARSLRAERARSDELLASLEDRVQARTAELEHANAEKSRFLANMSHELRTPLNGVIALSETLAGEQTTPRNVEVAELIVNSGRLLERVLTDILDFSKIEAGEMRLEQHPFDLRTLVSGVAELHRASALAKGLSLNWRLEPSITGSYLGDGVRLTQVLSNLLSNAVKFTPSGRVDLVVRGGEAGLHFSISDTGIGFDQSVRATLFQRFEQADLSIRRRFGGTGLGLAICQSLGALMGGRIEARSAPGMGSVFSFEVALERAIAETQAPQARPVEGVRGLRGVRILLAEDHPTNQKIVQIILDSAGVDLTVVENGRLALEILRREAFDLVLMDMQMPELDGLAATSMLRQREAMEGLRRTPVIMLTANALDEHKRASREAGADRHLSKPLRAMELLAAIDEAVFGARTDSAAASERVLAG